ncbi:MAG: hypothetical protein N3D09_02590 [Archaeoglobaceae archaeon]|nr:hypothetical protein [Archaeoglobaceae archaeon]
MIFNLLSVNTKWNREKVVEFMEQKVVDAVFLDLPASFGAYISKNMLPIVDIGYVQDLTASEPILQFCWKKKIPIYCYLDDSSSSKAMELQLELIKLVLKSKITGKIKVEEWKNLIFKDISLRETSNDYVAMRIYENAMNENVCLNLSPQVEKFLVEEGFEVKTIKLYDFRRPIDRLYEFAMRELGGEKVSDEIYLELIKKHISFIDAVVEMGYEEACKFFWV